MMSGNDERSFVSESPESPSDEIRRKARDIPIPKCKNTNRRTAKCRRMCCRREDDRVREDEASGIQTRIDKKGTVQQQLAGWWQPR